MFNALGRLCDELAKRKYFIEGDPMADRYVLPIRLTHLLGLMGLYVLWRRNLGEEPDEVDEFARRFVFERAEQLLLWGEAAVPQFLSVYFYRRTVDSSFEAERMLMKLVRTISVTNQPRAKKGLPSPYYDADQVVLDWLGDEENRIKERFGGVSYALQCVVDLLVRLNLKQTVKLFWPDISRIAYAEFKPEGTWRFFQWKPRKGLTTQKLLKSTQAWADLVSAANDVRGRGVPSVLRGYPVEYLALMLVYPHRLTASGVRWLDHQLLQAASS